MKTQKHYAIVRDGKAVTNDIPIPMIGEPLVIFFSPARQEIGNNKLAMHTELTLNSSSSEIKAAVDKYLGFHYKLFSMVRYAKLKPYRSS